MRDLHGLLTAADPIAERPELPPEDALAIRRAAVSAAAAARPAGEFWPGAVPVAALVVITVAAGVAVARKLPPDRETPPTAAASVGQGTRQQVRFVTPGGTRVIWTLDENF